jgi:hypothetical protein
MAKERSAIDISDIPELARLAEEVSETRTPRALRRGNVVIARIVPAAPRQANPRVGSREVSKATADMEAFRAAAGSWKGTVDGEQLKKDIQEARGSDRDFSSL